MNNFSITDNFIEIATENYPLNKVNFSQIKNVKIIYYHTYFQKLMNLFLKKSKKSYKFIIYMKNQDKQVIEISENEKVFLKQKLDFINKQIKKHKTSLSND